MKFSVQASESNFDDLSDHVWSMLNEMTSHNYFRSHASDTWRPRINIYETRDHYLVCAALAGMAQDQIEVEAHAGELRISGDRPKPALPTPAAHVSVPLMEIDSGRFHRKVPIPPDVDVDRISASYRKGYLWVIIPRQSKEDGSTNS